MNAAIVVSNAIKSKSWDYTGEELRLWKHQEYPSPTVADFLDMNPIYHWRWDTIHIANKASKISAKRIIEFTSNVNPYLMNWYDDLMVSFFMEPDFWKDYFIDGWYVPATGESARRYYTAWQCKHLAAPHVASGVLPLPRSAIGKLFDLSNQSDFWSRNFLKT